MGTKLYVGNLSYNTTADQLKELFSGSGTVASADLIMDRQTGRSKGFAFIEMSTDEEAAKAISALHETELDGRTLNVNEAKPREERPAGGGGGRSFGGNNYGSKRF
jgi:RNA recognition motif-containing protein